MKDCKHNLKHNKEQDYIFCNKCGKKWEVLRPADYPIYWTTYGNINNGISSTIDY